MTRTYSRPIPNTQAGRLRQLILDRPGLKPKEIQPLFPHLTPKRLGGMMWAIRQDLPRQIKVLENDEKDKPNPLQVLLNKYGVSQCELDEVLRSSKLHPSHSVSFDLGKTGRFRFAVASDTHIGQAKFDQPTWDMLVRIITRDECKFMIHPGDHLEGMSGRPGHVYELAQIGFAAQKKRCIELYSQIPVPIYGIDGNHDQWFKQKADIGCIVGEELQEAMPGHYHHLGEWEGILTVSGIKMMLFHANDGTAYANSYKGQKLIESLLEDEKPQLLFSGHYHKSLFQYLRGIYQWESGTICRQTGFMRGKKIPAHVGFWVVEVEHQNGNVLGVSSKWYSLPQFK